MNLKCCVVLVALSGVMTVAASPTVMAVAIEEGGEATHDVSNAPANKLRTVSTSNIIFLGGNGKVNLANAGSSCTINPCIFVTNGTGTYPSGQPQAGHGRLFSVVGGLDLPTRSYDLPKGVSGRR